MASHLLPHGRGGRGSYYALDDESDNPPSGCVTPTLEPGPDEKEPSSSLLTTDASDHASPAEPRARQSTESFRFSHRAQFMRLLWYPILPRWLVSLLLCILIAGHLRASQAAEMSGGERNQWWFASLLIALATLFGANLKSAGSEACDMVRWRILTHRTHTKGEIDAVLASGRGWGAAVHGSWAGMRKKKPLTSLGLAVGPCVLVATVLCVSFTGFLYTFENGHKGGLVHGKFLKAELKHIYYGSARVKANGEPSKDVEYFSAHLYGDMSYVNIDGLPELPMWAGKPALIDDSSKSGDEQSWIYNFRDSNLERSQWHTSGRSVRITAKCRHYAMVEGQLGNSDSITYLNGTTRTVLYNLQKFAPGATVWANARVDYLDPGEDEKKAEGDMFDCDVTVSGVVGGQPGDDMPDEVAAIFAGSIGLRGFISGNDKWQYARYSRDMFWGEEMGNNATSAAYKASRFAAGAIAIADVLSPRKEAVGQTPSGPNSIVLVVQWAQAFIVLSGLLVLHLALAVIALWYANSVIIPENSVIATGRLLRRVDQATMVGEQYLYGIQPSAKTSTASGEQAIAFYKAAIGSEFKVTARSKFPAGWYEH